MYIHIYIYIYTIISLTPFEAFIFHWSSSSSYLTCFSCGNKNKCIVVVFKCLSCASKKRSPKDNNLQRVLRVVCVCAYTYGCVHISMGVCLHLCVCVCMHPFVSLNVCMGLYIHLRVSHRHLRVSLHTCMGVHIYVWVCAYIYVSHT
jgi:hypothetical protein